MCDTHPALCFLVDAGWQNCLRVRWDTGANMRHEGREFQNAGGPKEIGRSVWKGTVYSRKLWRLAVACLAVWIPVLGGRVVVRLSRDVHSVISRAAGAFCRCTFVLCSCCFVLFSSFHGAFMQPHEPQRRPLCYLTYCYPVTLRCTKLGCETRQKKWNKPTEKVRNTVVCLLFFNVWTVSLSTAIKGGHSS